MEKKDEDDKILLPHHVQQQLCETRLPYRQGRKLTAVKVYSIANESNHLLIFGVPSLNLRQETKTLFMRFGKLIQFNISKDHASEAFTETYHAQYERIQAARLAKRTIDTKNYYGGVLHVCYAPELETVNETHEKIMQRQSDVLRRLNFLKNEDNTPKTESIVINENKEVICSKNLLNMGQVNIIKTGIEIKKNKRKINDNVGPQKRFKPCFVQSTDNKTDSVDSKTVSSNVKRSLTDVTEVEIVDCTSVDTPTVSNINEALNYSTFGEEVVIKMPVKPVNKIKFNVNKKSLI